MVHARERPWETEGDEMPTLPLLLLTLLSTQVQALPRVRSEDPSVAAVIASATDRLATFKQADADDSNSVA